jgi:hypothetical protein
MAGDCSTGRPDGQSSEAPKPPSLRSPLSSAPLTALALASHGWVGRVVHKLEQCGRYPRPLQARTVCNALTANECSLQLTKGYTMKKLSSLLVAAAFAAAPAFAQQSGVVNVDIKNVANNIAQNLKVDVSQIPVTVQAPIDVAAAVCGVAANVLGTQAASGSGSCTATSTNTALNTIVQQQLKKG